MSQLQLDLGSGLTQQPVEVQPQRKKRTAVERRDAGIARVMENAGDDFKAGVRRVLAEMPLDEFTSEDIRMACIAAGVKPHHHNAWGGVTAGLLKQCLIVEIGAGRMKEPKSHARRTPLYRRA